MAHETIAGGLFDSKRHTARAVNEWEAPAQKLSFSRPGFVAPSSESFYKAVEDYKTAGAQVSHMAPGRVAAIEGLGKGGMAAVLRKVLTSFGSPWQGLGAGPELSVAGRRRRDRYYQNGVTPYGLTPGQMFDVADTGSTVFRAGQGQGLGMAALTFAGLDVAISAGTAPRDKIIGRAGGAMAAQAAGIASWFLGGPIGSAVGFVAGGAVGTLVGGPGGAAVGASAGATVGRWVGKLGLGFAIDPFVRKIGGPINQLVAISKRRVDFGQGYQDSEGAYTMRQRALREMQGSLLNAYQFLGKEAQLMHA